MAMHPEIQAKAQRELDDLLPIEIVEQARVNLPRELRLACQYFAKLENPALVLCNGERTW